MTKGEYIKTLASVKVDAEIVAKIENVYGATLPDVVKKIVSNAAETIFFDDDYRILSLGEIEDAENDLHVDFKAKGIIPLVDCGENDFIVYHFNDDIWSKFNIIDETVFKKQGSLDELLK